jgi:hypothetical protein
MRKLSFLFTVAYLGLAAVSHYMSSGIYRNPDTLPIFAETLGLILLGLASSLGMFVGSWGSIGWLRSIGIVSVSMVIWVVLYILGHPKFQHSQLSDGEAGELAFWWTILIACFGLLAALTILPTILRESKQPQANGAN